MTKDFATGLALVERIGASAEETDHHPDITLTFSDVVVSLRSHDVGRITSRDLRLATRIGEHADDLGVEADVAGLTQPGLGLDTRRHADVAPFHAALLGSSLENGKPVDSTGQVPTLWCQNSDDAANALGSLVRPLPTYGVRNPQTAHPATLTNRPSPGVPDDRWLRETNWIVR
ncbi:MULTISPECIES: 4a-hydroxytetrahydrobiopterin dehydratase [Dermacoccus]|uniref:Putative pterin-4-alpha-carbinolamine dehydratase n=2 Tax=Dermacoccus TaxID=57495 RepID=A0A417Z8Q7_9MICO|nr:4a-hydroxytetrahydrobiopterin dehydratase [Dermacoccus abyssi]RHW47031.1 hypothetical protein D1832_03190 [Dermacoccus abyssi]